MFSKLINDTKAAVGAVIGKYALRASVAVPFVVAAGFATAATTLMLVDRYGALAAYWVMAGVFALLGTVATFVVSAHEQEAKHAVPDSEALRQNDAGVQAATQLPLALLGTLLTTPFGPAAAGTIARTLVRHLPLAVLVALIGLLIFAPSQPSVESNEARPSEPNKPEHPAAPDAPEAQPHREAA